MPTVFAVDLELTGSAKAAEGVQSAVSVASLGSHIARVEAVLRLISLTESDSDRLLLKRLAVYEIEPETRKVVRTVVKG